MLCYFYQWLLEKQIDRKTPSYSLPITSHLSKCPRCKAFYASLKDIEKELATSQPLTLPADRIDHIKATVLRNLDSESNKHARPMNNTRSKQLPIRFAVRSIAAVLIAVALIGLYLNRPKPQEPFANNNLITQIVDDSHKLQSQIIRFAKLPEQPIQGEIDKLTNDVRGVLTFLINCTPQTQPEAQSQTNQQYYN